MSTNLTTTNKGEMIVKPQPFVLNEANYFSPEANWAFMSVSQFKDFFGTLGHKGCEAKALAKLNGDWVEETSTAMLVGSYVDAHFEGSLDLFRAKNPQIFLKDGVTLKSEYKRAETVIDRIERDPMFMYYMGGEKQTIITFELFGVMWKMKIDSYLLEKAIVDLKVMKDLTETFYVQDIGGRMNFIEYWGYDIQGAIYQAGVHASTGEWLPFFIAGADKKEFPNIAIIGIDQQKLDDTLSLVEHGLPRVLAIKAGAVEPDRCNDCDYCRHTKVLSEVVAYDQIGMGV